MKTFLVTINEHSWKVNAGSPRVAIKFALDAASKTYPKGLGSKEGEGFALHIYYEEATP